MRIAVDARSLLCATPRGEGKSLLRLYTEIASLRPDLQAFFFGDDRATRYDGPLPLNVKAVRIPTLTSRLDVWEDVLFPLRARLAGCDLMHCASSSAPRYAGLPVLLTVHDLIPIVFDDGHDAHARRRFARRLGFGLAQAKAVAAVSDNTCRDLQTQFPAAGAARRVIHWGGDLTTETSDPAMPGPPTVLVFGGEAHRKNTDYAIDRFIGAAMRVPSLRLDVVGIASPAQRARLDRKLADAGLAARVRMPGFVSERELKGTVDRAAMLLYLSLYEGFGLPVLEAIGQGLPVIASDRSSLPELLDGAPGCFSLEDPQAIEDAIVRLAVDPAARRDMAAAQRPVMHRFRWSKTAEQYLELMEKTCRA